MADVSVRQEKPLGRMGSARAPFRIARPAYRKFFWADRNGVFAGFRACPFQRVASHANATRLIRRSVARSWRRRSLRRT